MVGIDSEPTEAGWRVRSHTGDPKRMQKLARATLDWIVEAEERGAGMPARTCSAASKR